MNTFRRNRVVMATNRLSRRLTSLHQSRAGNEAALYRSRHCHERNVPRTSRVAWYRVSRDSTGEPPLRFDFCCRSLFRALVFSDRLRLLQQRIPKRAKHLQQQIEFSQTLAPRTHSAQKKLELNASTTVSNRQHVVAPFVLAATTRFSFCEYERSVTS